MNLFAAMPAAPAELSPLPIPATSLDPALLAMTFSLEMQDCAAPVADQAPLAEPAEGAEAPEAATAELAFFSLPAFFAPIQPPLPQASAPVGMPAEQSVARSTAPLLPAASQLAQPALEADAALIKSETAAVPVQDLPDQPVRFELNVLPSLPLSAASEAAPAQWAPIKLEPAQPGSWPRHLEAALKDRLDVQLGHGIERAVIKLSPPMLGSLEISIKHEAGALSVQLHASNSDVTKQLHAITDHMRADLSLREYNSVAVEVRDPSANKDGAPKKHAPDKDEVGQALAELDEEASEFGSILARI